MHGAALQSTWTPAGGRPVDEVEASLALGQQVYLEQPRLEKVYGAVESNPKKPSRPATVQSKDQLLRVVLLGVLPPVVFVIVSMLLSFGFHFRHPGIVWGVVSLFLLPSLISLRAARKSRERSLLSLWFSLSAFLFFLAFLMASVVGELSYKHFSYPFYFLEAMKVYVNVDPAETSGVMMMDAGKVYFSEGSRIATDLAMSYTSWDIYCVAPITTSVGLPSQNARGVLNRYDLWAVGVNCCKSAEANFNCGEISNQAARAGLRQVGDERRDQFRLAVEQAEALYDIHAPHPVFFHWVEDPVDHESEFFAGCFRVWVFGNLLHMVINSACIVIFLLLFGLAPRDVTDLSLLDH
jgi:hypothetical protein